MLKFLNQFQHKQEMRESKDEILVGKPPLTVFNAPKAFQNGTNMVS